MPCPPGRPKGQFGLLASAQTWPGHRLPKRQILTVALVAVGGYLGLRPWLAGGWQLPVVGLPMAVAACAAALLVPLNLGLEAAKWRTALRQTVRWGQAWRAVVLGTAFGLVTPNRLGDYYGRQLGFDPGRRATLVVATALCRMAQWVPLVLVAAGFALQLPVVRATWGPVPELAALWAALLIGLALLAGWALRRWRALEGRAWLRALRGQLQQGLRYLRRLPASVWATVVLLSCLRTGVYLAQFGLLLYATGAAADAGTALWVASAVLVTKSVLPSLTWGELGVRELLTVSYGVALGLAEPPLVLASLLLFTLNLGLPGLVGALLLPRTARAVAAHA